MLRLPQMVEARVVDAGTGQPLAEILVSLHLSVRGRYYYGTLVGLTDSAGVARTSREAVERAFAEDRAFYLMDYRVPLAECDSEGELVAAGGGEFVERQRHAALSEAVGASTLAPEARRMVAAARNGEFEPASVRLDLSARPDRASAVLRLSRGAS